jgi:hypothetical protein
LQLRQNRRVTRPPAGIIYLNIRHAANHQSAHSSRALHVSVSDEIGWNVPEKIKVEKKYRISDKFSLSNNRRPRTRRISDQRRQR